MRSKFALTALFFLIVEIVAACPACEKQQPKITLGLTHGAGPQSNWDWVIIAIIFAITVLTFIFSLKYLFKPGEKNSNHIKQTILNNG
jgi:NADH:ubiquinone oxidoreductase subunit 3 (subunit A)